MSERDGQRDRSSKTDRGTGHRCGSGTRRTEGQRDRGTGQLIEGGRGGDRGPVHPDRGTGHPSTDRGTGHRCGSWTTEEKLGVFQSPDQLLSQVVIRDRITPGSSFFAIVVLDEMHHKFFNTYVPRVPPFHLLNLDTRIK